MKILVIGSKGFIGRHTLEYFEKKYPNQIYGADVVVDYTTQNYFLIDSTNSDFFYIFKHTDFDFCINCSGAASVPDSIINPMRDYVLNTVNVFKILNAIKELQPSCKFINLSSAAVYGNPLVLPIKEESKLLPLSPYGYHKKQAEEICKEFFIFFGVKTLCLRIFSAYGEGLSKQLFWDLYQKSKRNSHIVLFGTGLESRDFIYIKDLMQVFNIVIDKAIFDGKAINVANGEEITIKEASEIFYSHCNSEISVEFSQETRKGDPTNWVADISKLKLLGYNRQFSLALGLQNVYTWIKEKD